MAPTLRSLPVLLLSIGLLSGCSSAAFLAANLPTAIGGSDRTGGLAYGPESRQELDLYVPQAPATEPRPVIVFIHGGSWATGSKNQYRFVGNSLAEQGFIASLPNYRLSPAVKFPVFVEDAAQAVAWTLHNIERYGGDPRRVFVMGHSAGAHIALLLALDRHYLADAGASADDLRGAIGLSGPYDFKINTDRLRMVFGAAPDPRATQPIGFVRGDAPPLLLVHGTGDQVCWSEHSIRLTEQIRAAGGSAELKLYPGLGHGSTVGGFSALGRNQSPSLADVTAFLRAH